MTKLRSGLNQCCVDTRIQVLKPAVLDLGIKKLDLTGSKC